MPRKNARVESGAGPRYRYYSEENKREMVRLIDSGVPPLDVAQQFGIRIYHRIHKGKPSGYRCNIYWLYPLWSARYSVFGGEDAEGLSA